ncbi:hypothetical protein CR513_38410, partial [Mucuna pruriens]
MLILLRPLKIRKGRTIRVLWKGLLNERNQRRMKNLPTTSLRTNTYKHLWSFPYNFLEWTTIFYYSQSLNVFKSFKAEVELQLGKKIKVIKFDHGGEYYGRYDELGEQLLGPFAFFLKEWNFSAIHHAKQT